MDIPTPEPLDGRVLSEALSAVGPPLRGVELRHLDAKSDFPNGTWQQYLRFTEVNGVRYLDEANGWWTLNSSSTPMAARANTPSSFYQHARKN